ncbi:MAG TPA: DUF1080 domain-containing protein [Bryobacteraceae bacterium]|nr:DUF1080 domain-containing protein [Bryobacteraceae bacterium]
MKRILVLVVLLAAACAAQTGNKSAGGWVKMFNGKDLDGWKPTERPEAWTVKEGAIVGDGDRSHLFWMKQECENCEFKATVKISDKGNSGMYFRAAFAGPGWPKGYEAQVNSTHPDPVKTGSLYNFVKIFERLVEPDAWFTQHIIADGNHIIIKVNDKTVVDYVDEKNTHARGYLALQQHNQGSIVMYKDLMFRPLPSKK